jgi:hypothetical protein
VALGFYPAADLQSASALNSPDFAPLKTRFTTIFANKTINLHHFARIRVA